MTDVLPLKAYVSAMMRSAQRAWGNIEVNHMMAKGGDFGFGPEMGVLGQTYVPTVGFHHTQPLPSTKPYKEGGSSIKFESFHEDIDTMKALIFLQQFDAASLRRELYTGFQDYKKQHQCYRRMLCSGEN